ncbi:MAG: 6-pyruvoyl tetrahydropterin synthase family protein [Pirellulaceae bacterium]|nr:6-pyruvoyl tetrahydropterin synthase family protein [Planctomycetales bacterium]
MNNKPKIDPSSYRVRLEKDYLVFSAAHFITFNGDICERLHGHNYRVEAEVEGPLDENHYVIDFIALRDLLQEILAEWDHRMLLPTRHPEIRVTSDERETTATFRDRRWVFPSGDCALIDIPNTTAEKLAEVIAQRVHDGICARHLPAPQVVRVGVDENHGQWGIATLTF